MKKKRGRPKKEKVEVAKVVKKVASPPPPPPPPPPAPEFKENWREEYQKVLAKAEKMNPNCGRGGCLHPKWMHNDITGECHAPGCSCMKFIAPD